MRARLTAPVRDAALATLALLGAAWAGSRGFADVDPALVGYLGATLIATFATVQRASAFWRRPASAFYARALASALRSPALLRATLAAGGRDLAAQRFIARRSRIRWLAHLLLSLGTLAAFAITLPLVCGWLRFAADGEQAYRIFVAGVPAGRVTLDGPTWWLLSHGLVLAAWAVLLGAAYFAWLRLRARRLPDTVTTFHLAPLLLLATVALTGLALPATHGQPALFALAARAHEFAVIALLLAIPCSKLGHVLIRPLHLGAQLVRRADARRVACLGCGAPLAPSAQQAAVAKLLATRGFRFAGHPQHCSACRRRALAAAQATLLGAHFHPPLTGTRPAPARPRDQAA